MATYEIQIVQCGHHIDLAAILCQATQPGFLDNELLLWPPADFV
jgi:hypothetical protein